MKRAISVALGAAAMVAVVFGVAQAQQKTISIGTGGTGGVYYPLGGGLANVLTKSIPGLQATAEVTGGSVDNLKLIGAGRSEVGFSMVDAALDAEKGQDKFKGSPVPVRTLMVLYPNQMHVVSIEGTGINTMADLKGKRVSTGSPGSATEVFAFRVIEAAGLDKDKDMRRERLGVAESVNALKDKKIDAFFWVGGLPTAAVTDLSATPGTKLKMIDIAQYTDKMVAKYGNIYSATTIPKATYTGMEADNKNVAVWNIMMVNESMSEDLAYQLTKLLFEKREELALTHKEALNLKTENQTKAKAGVPFHKGALKYFAEAGIKVD